MHPILDHGCRISVEKVPFEAVAPGDILAYFQDEKLVTHVVHFALPLPGSALLLLKGVNNPYGDLPLRWERILGRVTRIGAAVRPRGPERCSVLAWGYLFRYALGRCKRLIQRAGGPLSRRWSA